MIINVRVFVFLLHESGKAELTWLMGPMKSVLIALLMPAISVKPVLVLHIQAAYSC